MAAVYRLLSSIFTKKVRPQVFGGPGGI